MSAAHLPRPRRHHAAAARGGGRHGRGARAGGRRAREPDGQPPAGPAGPAPARGGARRGGRLPRPRPGRHRLHLRRHRVRQPGRARARRGGPAGPGRGRASCTPPSSTRPCAKSARAAAKAGIEVRELPVDRAGIVDPDALARTLSSRVTSVAVMTANNETGVHPAAARPHRGGAPPRPQRLRVHRRRAGRALPRPGRGDGRRRPGLAERAQGRAGPVGVGALAVAGRVVLEPRQYGGGQERERRSGTQDVAGAVGLATALRLVAAERATAGPRVAALRDRLRDGLLGAVDGAHRTVPAAPGSTCCRATSTCASRASSARSSWWRWGSRACASRAGRPAPAGRSQPSHVLAAMGVAPELAAGALRFTLGYGTTDADVDRALAVVPAVVAALRRGADGSSGRTGVPVAHWSHAGARGHVGRRRLLRGGRAPGRAGP